MWQLIKVFGETEFATLLLYYHVMSIQEKILLQENIRYLHMKYRTIMEYVRKLSI